MDDAAHKIKMVAALFGVAGNKIVKFKRAGSQLEEPIRLDELLKRLKEPGEQLELFGPK